MKIKILLMFFVFTLMNSQNTIKSPGLDEFETTLEIQETIESSNINNENIEFESIKKNQEEQTKKDKKIKENKEEVIYVKINGKEQIATPEILEELEKKQDELNKKKEENIDNSSLDENNLEEKSTQEEIEPQTIEEQQIQEETKININKTTNKLILDMDFSTDVDDACALRLAINLHNKGILDLKAVTLCVNSDSDLNLRAADGLLDYGNVHVPIGKSSIYNSDNSPYWDILSNYSDGTFEQYDSVKLWRKIISENEKVNILTTGYLSNLKAFCESPPDEYSNLTGMELLNQKVENVFIVGGVYTTGVDNNFAYRPTAIESAEWIINNVQKPLIFITTDVGGPLICGAKIQREKPDDPLSKALYAFGTSSGRAAWDPMGVYIATFGKTEDFEVEKIDITISNGTNTIIPLKTGKHFRIYRNKEDLKFYENKLEELCY